MQNGEIVETGPTSRIFEAPQHPYTKRLIEAEPKGQKTPPAPDAPVVLRAADVKVWFPIKKGVLRRTAGYVRAVDGISLTIHEGQTVGVVGESGSGKTTLGMALIRLQSSQGEIVFEGHDLQALSSRTLRPLRREMQVVFQDPYGSLSPRMSIGQIIEEGLKVHGIGGDEEERDRLVVQALEEVELDPGTRHRYPHEFSGGQRQRIAIARAMVLKPRFVVLDEPTSALDRSVQAQIVDLLRELQRRHKLAYMFISHDLRVVRALSDYVLVMRDGVVVEQGPTERIFEEPREVYTKALMAAAFDLETAADAVAAGTIRM
jgi:microcin C transport system ATP-binding protein